MKEETTLPSTRGSSIGAADFSRVVHVGHGLRASFETMANHGKVTGTVEAPSENYRRLIRSACGLKRLEREGYVVRNITAKVDIFFPHDGLKYFTITSDKDKWPRL